MTRVRTMTRSNGVKEEPRNERLWALWKVDEKSAIQECRLAIIAAKGDGNDFVIDRAAQALNIGRRTLFRWIKEHPEITKGL